MIGSGLAPRAILFTLLSGLVAQPAAASDGDPAPAGPLVDLAALVAEAGAEVALSGSDGADGPLGGIVAARLRLADNVLPTPRDRIFFTYDYFDDVRLAAPVTPREDPGFERSFLESVALRIPFPTDPLLLDGPRDEFGPYGVASGDPVYEGGGPGDPNFGKNRGINAFRGAGGWVIYSTVYDGSFTDVPTGTVAYLMPGVVLMIIPTDELSGWEQVTVHSPDAAVAVDLSNLPEIVVEGVEGDTLLVAGDQGPEPPPEDPTTTTTVAAPTTTAAATVPIPEGGGLPWPLFTLAALAIGIAGGATWWLRRR